MGSMRFVEVDEYDSEVINNDWNHVKEVFLSIIYANHGYRWPQLELTSIPYPDLFFWTFKSITLGVPARLRPVLVS